MSNSQKSPVWMFMAATAMATTVSTLAATAMVKADAAEPVEVACTCQTPAPVAQMPAPACDAPEPAPSEPAAPAAPEPAAPEPEPEPEAKADQPAHTVTTTATVEGTLDKQIIRRIVRAHINEIRYCYNEGLQRDDELAGRVAIQFTVGSEGKVTSAHVSEDTLDDQEVSSCMAKAVERWMFPRPADGKDVVITYPFELEPG